MDITDHFGKIVESLVNEISSNVKAKVDDIINVSIAEKLSTFKFEDFIHTE